MAHGGIMELLESRVASCLAHGTLSELVMSSSLCDDLLPLFPSTEQTVTALMMRILSSKPLLTKSSGEITIHKGETEDTTDDFLARLILLRLLSRLTGANCMSSVDSQNILQILAWWRSTLGKDQVQSPEFRSALLDCVKHSPQLFLAMFFKENGDEGWKIIFEDFNLLLSCLRLQLSSRDTLLHQVKCSLSSKDVTVRNFSLRIIANHLGRCLADNEVNVSEIWHTLRPILELAVESLQSRWIPSPGTTQIYHLVHVFSTTKAKELQEAAMTQGFYLKDDIDLCGTVLGLVLSLRARMTSHEANIYLSLQRPLVVEPSQSEWFDQEELVVQKTSRLWTMLVRSVLSDCPKRPSDSIAMHTGILLCAWGSLLAIEKVMTVNLSCCNDDGDGDGDGDGNGDGDGDDATILRDTLQSIHCMKFSLAFSLRQLKYAQLYLGSGSLASLATTRDDFGSVLPMAEELYQNSVSRSLVDSSTATERTTDDIWSTGLVRGYDVPVEAAVRQFEHSVRAFQHARTTAQTLLLSTAQVTDFGEALVYDDGWWEMNTMAMIASCHALQESLHHVLSDAAVEASRDPSTTTAVAANNNNNNNTNTNRRQFYVDLLVRSYGSYQQLVSQDEQDVLKRVVMKLRKIKEAGGCSGAGAGAGRGGHAGVYAKSKARRWANGAEANAVAFFACIGHTGARNSSALQRTPSSQSSLRPTEESDDDVSSDDPDGHDRTSSQRHHRLRHALSLSSTKKQFASTTVARKLASKLIPHAAYDAVLRQVHALIVVCRPRIPEDEEGTNPLFPLLSKALSATIQDTLWWLRAEWLALLDTLVKIALQEESLLLLVMHPAASSPSSTGAGGQQQQQQQLSAAYTQQDWQPLLLDMLEVFSAEIMHSVVVGVSKVVFENLVEVLYAIARALYPEDSSGNGNGSGNGSGSGSGSGGVEVSSRNLARTLVVLQEVGASAEVKLQRALLNLMVQLSGRDTIAWKIAIPFLLESCLLQWQRQTRRATRATPRFKEASMDNDSDEGERSSDEEETSGDEDRGQSDDADGNSDDDDEKEKEENEENDDDRTDPAQRRRQKIDEQVEALDAYLQIQLLSRLHQDDTAAEACFMMMPEVSLDRCRLRMDDKVAESLWLELLRRVAFEWKSYGSVLQAMVTTPPSATIPTATAVPRPRSTVMAAKRDSPSLESLEEVHTASRKVSLLMEMFGLLCGKLFVDSGPWRTGAPASAPDDDPRSTRKTTMSPRLAVTSKRERVQGREKTRGTLWDSMPWKCKLPMMTLTTTVLRQLSHEVKRAMKMVPALLVHDRAHPSNDTHRHRLLAIRWPPPMTAAAGPMGSGGVSSCDDDDGGEDEGGDEGDDDSSHANLFPILMTLAMGNEGDQEAMNMLLLLKHFLLREQFYLQQQLQETAMERNVDVAPRDRATAGDHSVDESSDVDDHDRHEASTGHRSSSAVRSPAPSVARLLGLSTSKTSSSLQASPVGRTKTNGKSPRGSGGGGGGGSGRTSLAPSSPSKQQQQQQWKRLMQQRAQWELQSKKYLEILDRFVAVETDLQALHGKLTPLVREVARDHAEIIAFQQGVASLLTKLVSTTKYLGSPERKRSRRGKRLVDIDGGAIVGEAEDDDEGEAEEEERVSPTRTTPSKRAKLMSKASPKTAVPVASSSSSTMTKKKRRRTAKTAVNSRNSVVNEWLKETDGSDDYADLENFLV